jgi:hypothetical protein
MARVRPPALAEDQAEYDRLHAVTEWAEGWGASLPLLIFLGFAISCGLGMLAWWATGYDTALATTTAVVSAVGVLAGVIVAAVRIERPRRAAVARRKVLESRAQERYAQMDEQAARYRAFGNPDDPEPRYYRPRTHRPWNPGARGRRR